MSAIVTENHGPLILSSTYWGSGYEEGGKVFCSVNAGAIRLLVPRSNRTLIEEARKASVVILSRGPWPATGRSEGIEVLLEDGSDSPHALHLTPASFDVLPAEPPEGREWVFTLWDLKKGKPHKAVERRCLWRRVPEIPWLKPWTD